MVLNSGAAWGKAYPTWDSSCSLVDALVASTAVAMAAQMEQRSVMELEQKMGNPLEVETASQSASTWERRWALEMASTKAVHWGLQLGCSSAASTAGSKAAHWGSQSAEAWANTSG